MITKLKSIAKTDLIKTSFLTSIFTFVKILSGFVLNKLVAIYVGPVGIALVGQFNNFLGILITLGSGGIGTGIIKYIAQHRDDETEIRKTISTGFIITALCSLAFGLIVFLFAGYFSNLLFKTQEYRFIIVLSAFSLLFASLNSFLMCVLNGRKEILKYTWASITISLLTLALSLLLIVKYKITGVLTALVAVQFLAFVIIFLFVLKSHWFKVKYLFRYFDKATSGNLLKYSAMTLVPTFLSHAGLIVVRNHIGNNLSWQDAGYWQGVWSISEVYLTFINSALAFYYLPRLSEIKDAKELRNEIFSTSKIVMPIVMVMALLVFLFKEPLISLLFTKGFSPMLPLFKYQLMGDVFQIASSMLYFQMLAKAMTKVLIISEIIGNVAFVAFSIWFINAFGLVGPAIAFCVTYGLYFLFQLIYFRKQLLNVKSE